MIFGALENADCAALMPELNIEHPKSRHTGYVALKKALAAALTTDFCSHVAAICGADVKEKFAKINVCMWEKKPNGGIEQPSIVFGYPRWIRENNEAFALDEVIHKHIRNYNGNGLLICWDNNLYIKELAEPYDEDVLALAAIYYIAHLCGKYNEMVTHLKVAIPPIFTKTLYEPTARATYDPASFVTEEAQKTIRKNAQGVDINQLYRTIEDLDAKERDYRQRLAEAVNKRARIEDDIKKLLENPNACPALEVVNECLKQLGDITTKIELKPDNIRFTFETFISDWDEKDFQRQWDDRNSNLHIGILSFTNERMPDFRDPNNRAYKDFVKTLFNKVFGTKEYKLLITNQFELSLYPLAYNWVPYNRANSITGFTNPHLHWYVCWHDAQSAIINCFNNRNYDQIPLILKFALSQITFGGDIAPKYLALEMYRALIENNPARVFVDKDGYAYTIRELYDLLT